MIVTLIDDTKAETQKRIGMGGAEGGGVGNRHSQRPQKNWIREGGRPQKGTGGRGVGGGGSCKLPKTTHTKNKTFDFSLERFPRRCIIHLLSAQRFPEEIHS